MAAATAPGTFVTGYQAVGTADPDLGADDVNGGCDSYIEIVDEKAHLESSTCLAFANQHIMDQLENNGYFASTGNKPCRAASERIVPGEKEKLWAHIVISRIGKIDVKEESFQIQFMVTLMWRVNLESCGLSHLSNKAQASGYSVKLEGEEEAAFRKACRVPTLRIHNSIEFEDLEENVIRVFNGHSTCNYVVTSGLFKATIHCVYQLNHFPYDVQKLPIKFMIKQFDYWKHFEFTIASVHYFKHALRLSEWTVCIPTVKRSSPAHVASYLFLTLKRHHAFYELNIVHTMLCLECLGLTSFMCDSSIAGSSGRATLCVTLLLTIVAVKFTVASNLPTLPYNTRLDEYFSVAACGLGAITFISLVPQYYVNDYDRSSANLLAFGLSVFIVAMGYIGWFRMVTAAEAKESVGFEKIMILENAKNYYCFRYCTCPFLQNSEVIQSFRRKRSHTEDTVDFV
jgi:hypothetical protein